MPAITSIGRSFKGDSLGEVFLKIRKDMLDDKVASIVPSRVGNTIELLNPVIVLADPTKRLFYSEHRSYSLIYGIVEAYMLFNKTNSVKPFAMFNPKILEYSDDGATINSAYGSHIAEYIPTIVNKLRYDRDTRQAVLNIYTSKYGISDTKDVPCTLALHFLIRDGALNLTVYMRSNDLFWGFQYDVFMFTTLQEVIAYDLGIPIGTYTHCPTSLHVYNYHWDMFYKMRPKSIVEVPSISFNTDVSGAASASVIIERMCEGSGFVPAFVKQLEPIRLHSLRPIHLVMLEYLFRNDKEAFGKATVNLKLQNGWFAPFTKRWQKEV